MFATAPPTLWTFPCRPHLLAPSGDVDAGDYGWWERSLQSLWKVIGSMTRSIQISTDTWKWKRSLAHGKSEYRKLVHHRLERITNLRSCRAAPRPALSQPVRARPLLLRVFRAPGRHGDF